MEIAKVTSRGQITLPLAIRKKLEVQEGDKVVFYEEDYIVGGGTIRRAIKEY